MGRTTTNAAILGGETMHDGIPTVRRAQKKAGFDFGRGSARMARVSGPRGKRVRFVGGNRRAEETSRQQASDESSILGE